MGITPLRPPSASAARLDSLRELWTGAGIGGVETREITVERSFADFDDFWATVTLAASLSPTIAAMPPDDRERLKTRVRARLPTDAAGRITYSARANAVKGRLPG
jgi:hypothetical protein